MGQNDEIHIPVLFDEVLAYLPPKPGMRYLDGTLGLAGHSLGLLEAARKMGCSGVSLLGLDRDGEALELARTRLAAYEGVHTARACYSEFGRVLDELGWDKVDAALIDIGVSSLQLDRPERGFSFINDGPLDMRMDKSRGNDAAFLVNKAPRAKLKEIIEVMGEDPMAGKIAKAIEDARAKGPIETTLELAGIVERAYPPKWRATSRNHPATRTFQALRMAVNDELGELERFLNEIVDRLNVGGRVAVISFHSLEDRLVKHFFRKAENPCACPRQAPYCVCGQKPVLKVLTKKPVCPGEAEAAANPRAGSAKMRVAERI